MKFIRKNGRVIPIRERVASGMEHAVKPGALITGATIGALDAIGRETRRINPVTVAFWGLKGAVGGAVVGGAAGALFNSSSKVPVATDAEKAFKRAGALATIGSFSRVVRPFVSKTKVGRMVTLAGYMGGTLGSMVSAYDSAINAKKGTRGRVLAAGAAGSILGTNLMRFGGPIIKNRSAWGLKRII